MIALLRLRVLRLVRDIQKLYFMIFLPLAIAAFVLYIDSTQNIEPKMNSLLLNENTYREFTKVAIHNGTDKNIDEFLDSLLRLGVSDLKLYNGNFSLLLEMAPHMAALNINSYHLPNLSITAIYNDTAQHSLPIIINLINNALYRYVLYSNIQGTPE